MAGNMPAYDERLKLAPDDLINSLAPEEIMLVRLRDELYEGSWKHMRTDLENRLRGKPYIFKLVSRIEHDLRAVEFLECYEEKNGIDLGAILNEA